MRYALILELTVKNVTNGDQDFADLISPDWDYVIQSDTAQMHDTYDPVGGTFSTPAEIPPAEPPWPVIRTIKKEKWYDRWTDEDLGKMLTAAKTSEGMAGWMDWIRNQTALDLDNARISAKLAQGVAGGHITQATMDALLADVQQDEV